MRTRPTRSRTAPAIALVGMAFLAVLREGFETSVFLLAAFQASKTPLASGIGVILGVATAVVLGYLIYRGAVRINLQRFFLLTGLALVLVAAGLVASAIHTALRGGVDHGRPGSRRSICAGSSRRGRSARRCSPACSGSSRSRRAPR